MVLSDITSSQSWQHAGTTDITPAHCLAMALTLREILTPVYYHIPRVRNIH